MGLQIAIGCEILGTCETIENFVCHFYRNFSDLQKDFYVHKSDFEQSCRVSNLECYFLNTFSPSERAKAFHINS